MRIAQFNAYFLKHLEHKGWSDAWLRGANRRSNPSSSDPSNQERQDTITTLQWLVAIGASYLVIGDQHWNLIDPGAPTLILVCLLSAVLLQRMPNGFFISGLMIPGLLILDSLLIVSAMLLRDQTPWDLLLLFFFCVFIASTVENLLQIAVASVLLSLVFLIYISPDAKNSTMLNPDLLIRVPFILAISVFYGYMSNQVQKERKRIEQLEELMRLRRQFVSALAHDMKTPLNVIGGHAELLAGHIGGPQDETERSTSLKRIRDNIDRIIQLITDFLSVSKMECSGIVLDRNFVQINLIAETVVMQQLVIAHEKQLTVSLDLSKQLLPILGDASQLERALWNLINNAIKFTPVGGNISIRTRMVNRDACVEVTNSGRGIPKEDLPGLFSEFKRLKGSATTEGTGLGLFIVKTIVDAHNGSITVDSDEGAGTTFRILFPAAKESANPIKPNASDARCDKVLDRAA